MARIGPAEVRARYGVEPKQVPDPATVRSRTRNDSMSPSGLPTPESSRAGERDGLRRGFYGLCRSLALQRDLPSSVRRNQAWKQCTCQGWGRGFESHRPLQ